MGYRMSSADHIDWASRNFDFLIEAAVSNDSTDVPACPGWTRLDVLDHTAKGTGVWAAFLEADPSNDAIELLTDQVRRSPLRRPIRNKSSWWEVETQRPPWPAPRSAFRCVSGGAWTLCQTASTRPSPHGRT